MKITVNNEPVDLPASVILEQLQPRIDSSLILYKEWSAQKRLMVKTGLRTMLAFLEMQFGIRIEFPDSDDFVIMLLTNLPLWLEAFMERIELDTTTGTTWTDPDTKYKTITGLSIKFSH